MRTTVTFDDALLADAEKYTGIKEKSALVNTALKALVEREAARRLARLGGTEPQFRAPPRRRFGKPCFWPIRRSGRTTSAQATERCNAYSMVANCSCIRL